MKSAESDYRPIGLAVTAIAVVVGLWVAFALRPSSQFEWQHLHAEAANPRWLKVEITTGDKRRQYRENEPIYINFSTVSANCRKIAISLIDS